ncbi:hypothetical protein RHMOL_RhmolUnG0001900 [Rhododendron molle]|nr:hypothetical protein RHMOL_RhmolUnG0001900 [Rhododendron molle]
MDQSSSAASTTSVCPALKRASNDVGWEYGFLNPNNKERWKCKLCDQEYGGGVYRTKQHIANIKGNVAPCPKSTKEDKEKCKMALDKSSSKKRDKRIDDANVRAEVEVDTILECDEGEEVEVLGSRKRPHYVGPMDRYATAINPDLSAIQVVTDNASNNMAAAALLKLKRPNVFWTSCATHTINLMLEGIGKEAKFKDTIERAKKFTIFIYGHHRTLALMRKHTKKRDIVRPGVTRFATAFLTLQSLMEKKQELKMMCTTNEWGALPWVKTAKGKAAFATVMSTAFWNSVSLCLKVFAPLVMVLRLVDGDWKPSMGFVYGELKKAKEDIKEAYKQNEANYRPILKVIDTKALGRLDSPLHLTAYFLNPFYLFKDPTLKDDPIIMDGVFTCVESFFPDDFEVQNEVINKELLKYKNKEGGFGRALAAKGCEKNDDTYDPVGWWSNYGNHTPNLKKMAIRILSLTSSSSGCERNWSTFEGIHTKKRNRLDATRLNNLVYVQFNVKLVNKKRRVKERDVLLASEATNAQGWIVEGGDEEVEPGSGLTWDMVGEAMGVDEVLQPRRSGRNVRELDEDEFVSEDDNEEEDEDYEFESDGEQVLEGYGEEEEE